MASLLRHRHFVGRKAGSRGSVRRVSLFRTQVNRNATVRGKTQIDMQVIRLIASSIDRQNVIGTPTLAKVKFAGIAGYRLFEQVTAWIRQANRGLLDRTFWRFGINRSG